MSKRDKLLAAWKTQPQPDASVETVEAVLLRYFPDGFSKATGGSHQLRVSHPALFAHPHFVGGTLSIPVKGGQSVKPFYLKRIVEAIQIVQDADEDKKDEDKKDQDISVETPADAEPTPATKPGAD